MARFHDLELTVFGQSQLKIGICGLRHSEHDARSRIAFTPPTLDTDHRERASQNAG